MTREAATSGPLRVPPGTAASAAAGAGAVPPAPEILPYHPRLQHQAVNSCRQLSGMC